MNDNPGPSGKPVPDGLTTTAVLLLNLGGPDRPEAIQPYLRNLFSDPEMIRLPLGPKGRALFAALVSRLRVRASRKRYQAIGGTSPLGSITGEQAAALAAELDSRGLAARVYVGMRYWSPLIEDAVQEIAALGPQILVALPLYPQFSSVTSGSSLIELERTLERHAPGLETLQVKAYAEHGGYVEAVRQTVLAALNQVPEAQRPATRLLFSAHSIPERTVKSGDPYPELVQTTARKVMENLPQLEWALGYQSRVGPVRWLGPSTPAVLAGMARAGCRAVVAVPLGFVSDHLETLYDLDIELKKYAAGLGIATFVRAPSLNTAPVFISALADLVEQALSERNGKER